MPIKRVFGMLHREIRGLHEAAYVLAFFTFGSQIFALVRDRVFAHTFGAGETLDLFYAAFRVPDFLYALLASVVSLFVLIPFLERAEQESEQAVRRFLSDMFTVFSGALIIFALLSWWFAPELVAVLYGGFGTLQQDLLVSVLRVLLLQPLLLGISNLFAAYVQIKGRFLLYAVAPILYNIGIILGAVVLYPSIGLVGLAWGVVFGAALHLGVQTPFILSHGVFPRIVIPNWPRVYEVLRLSLPRTLTLSMQQIVLLVLVSIVSYFAVGSVSSFMFAWNLTAVPLAIIGVSYSVAAFPTLARLYNNKEYLAYGALIVSAARQIIFWALPATALFVVLRAQIVRVLLGTGAFDWDDTMLTAAVLALLTCSLVAQGLVLLLVRACYAAGKTWAPFAVGLASSLATIALALGLLWGVAQGELDLSAFERVMRVPEVMGSELLLVALAYSAGVLLQAFLLLWYVEKWLQPFVRGLARTAFHATIASLCAGAVAYATLNGVAPLVSLQTTLGVFVQGVVAAVVACLVWAVVLTWLQNDDFLAAREALHRRFTRKRVQEARGPIGE